MSVIDYMLYIWIGFFILSVIVEANTMNLIAIWFMPGTLIAIVLSLFSVPVWLQSLIWLVVTVVVFASTWNLSARLRKPKVQPTNADRVIGQTALVTETVSDRDQIGQRDRKPNLDKPTAQVVELCKTLLREIRLSKEVIGLVTNGYTDITEFEKIIQIRVVLGFANVFTLLDPLEGTNVIRV